jgi:TolA-binding protein
MQRGLRSAVKAIKEIRKNPECYFIYDFKAEIINQLAAEMYHSGEEDTAVGLLKLSIKEFPMATTYNQLAEIYFNQNKKTKAEKSYRAAFQQHPENQQAKEGLLRLRSRPK